MQETLEKIKDFADKAHGDQTRKYTPERYIVHPVRVMETCKKFTNDISILAAALLHDVLEDTPISKEEMLIFLQTILNKGQAERTVNLVVELTDVYVKPDFPKLNRRARKAKELERLSKTSADSQTIKYADIIANTREIVVHDPSFARVYLFECSTILRKLDKGNSALYKEANAIVDAGLAQLGN